jgi:cell division protein FtsW (lipid II flippase)
MRIRPIDWGALGANLGSTLLFTLLLLSPFLWGAAVWHWLIAVAAGLVLGLYFYVRRERFAEPGPDADETRFPPVSGRGARPTGRSGAACAPPLVAGGASGDTRPSGFCAIVRRWVRFAFGRFGGSRREQA